MSARGERTAPAVNPRGRCRCGHLAPDHMRVVPVSEPGGGGFRLEASGPCARCGESACPRFLPGG